MLTSIAYAAEAAPPAGAAPAGAMGLFGQLLPLIFLFVIFYFLLIRPQQKRAREQEKMISALKPGDTVITSGGVYGQILSIRGEVVTLDSTDKGRLKVAKRSVSGLVNMADLEEKG